MAPPNQAALALYEWFIYNLVAVSDVTVVHVIILIAPATFLTLMVLRVY